MSSLQEVMGTPIAHRGLHDIGKGVIENSPAAFKAAIAGGYAIECDLQLSADGVPMVIHDSTLDRVAGRGGRVDAMTADEIARVPLKDSVDRDTTLTFVEFLNLVGGRVPLAVELKDQEDGRNDELARAAAVALEHYTGAVGIISFNPRLLTGIRDNGFTGPLGILVERYKNKWAEERMTPSQRFFLRHLLHYPSTRFDFIDCHHESLNLPAVRLLRFLGFPVVTWTIKSQEDADRALQHCDQITFEGFVPTSG